MATRNKDETASVQPSSAKSEHFRVTITGPWKNYVAGDDITVGSTEADRLLLAGLATPRE